MKLLIVEDEHKIARALQQGFLQEHYVAEICYDGEEGLSAALNGEYDVIILDRMLPSMDGLEICHELRTKGVHTPIIMLTARSQIRDRVAGLNSGADDYMTKPFSFEELLARVRALLRRPYETLDNTLRIGDLTLNTVTYEVYRAGKTIALTSTEFALLEYLMRNPGRVLSKETIIQHVWDFDADVLPNTVEAYIGYLRQKIDRPFSAAPMIQTVRGFGYKLQAGT